MENLKNLFELLEAANPEICILVTDKLLDPPGPHILYANQKWEEATGYTLEEVKGKTPRILQGPLSDRNTLTQLKQCLQNGDKFSGVTTNYKKDGTTIQMAWTTIAAHEDYFVAIQIIPLNIKVALDKLKEIQEQATLKIQELTTLK